ncbi:hypothetical protein A5784_07565 [Mycobacterium sp. 852013-50091_SCH5140682]|uniref:DUF2235 domain-containing protein n=1 Tax=Mycobacterium sp. 852013-50091_SCH5140682 TaxID=1834109 RepID=UPI0007EB4709|nr:DUF2235 domain-containing protein [Mycobacterium sp. 852013-50091_SCH5140682]OBC08155.1 hypothetical protein A5784_07565 [Mycobacterium sp. 852013-50091_SCH5140682]
MPKRLVVCCDGTWNTPDQLAPTNVTKIALAVADHDAKGIEQRVFYSLGVGTGRGERVIGGAFGYGLSHNVIEAYRFLVENYAPGDELFFFGFSRGAFTARSTAGFVRNAGILRPQHTNRIDDAYALYRDRTSKTHPRSTESTLFRRSYSYESRIRFIGVWDTVGALGIPVSGFGLAKLVNERWAFHDTALSSYVDAAFQALAIDEKRGPFQPTLWAKQPDPPKDQRVEQVWFSGVHSDVGGGYPDHDLSDIALLWMVGRARGYGLVFDPTAFDQRSPGAGPPAVEDETLATRTQVYPDAFGQMHETRTGMYRLIRPYIRQPGSTDPDNEYVASSAVTRSRTLAPYATTTLGFVDGRPRTMSVRYLRR